MTRFASRAMQLLLAAIMLSSALMCISSVAADTSLSLDEGAFQSLDLDTSLSSMGGSLERSMTERELFDAQMSASGPTQPDQPPIVAGLNLVTSIPCQVDVAVPTPLTGFSVVLSPNDASVQAALGDVELGLTITYGSVLFSNVQGVTFNGPSVGATNTQIVGPLANINSVLASLYFTAETDFYGYAEIQWTLQNTGSAIVPQTNGTIIVVVALQNVNPSLVPLADNGVLAGFSMNENSVSPSFPGVKLNDPQGTDQTPYIFTITSFEGTLNLASTTGLTYTTNTPTTQVFSGLNTDVNAALASFTFTSSSWENTYRGQAGFVIQVTNKFYRTTAFIQGAITNIATTTTPIAGALAACRVSDITASSATVTWDATPAGFQATLATPAPTGYVLQFASNSAGPWSNGYSGEETTAQLTGLNRGTVYYCQVAAVNAGGNSPFSPVVPFTTLPTAPGSVTDAAVASATANSVTLSWTAPSDNGGGSITSYRITSQVTSDAAAIITTTVAFSPSVTIAGLQTNTAYTFTIAAANAAGTGSSVTVAGSTLGYGPVITSYVASGPSTGTNTFSVNVAFTIGFDIATNTPAVDSTAAINALFSFKPAIGKSYTGVWTDAKTLKITLQDAGSAMPVIGTATVSVIGTILASGGNSAASPSTSPALSGSFGPSGSLSGQVLTGQTLASYPSSGTLIPLGMALDISPLFADGSYQLTASVISPRLPDSYLSGTGFAPSTGLTIAVTGAPSALQSALATLAYMPEAGYSGPVSIQVTLTNKATGEVLASMVTALTITAAAAVPTVTCPDTVDVILEQFTAVPGVQIGYTDAAAAASSTFAVTVSTTHTGSAVFGTAATGVSFTPIVGTNSVSYQLVGGLSALNNALSKLQVKFTFSSNSAQANFAPDPYTVLVSVSDMNGGNATRSLVANINCNTATVTSPTVQTARLNDDLNSIALTLDLPVSDDFLNSPVFDCSTLLDSASVGLLGATPVCRFTSTVAIELDLGFGATFVPGAHTLNIKAGALQRCVGGTNASPAAAITVSGPLHGSAPAAFISGPQVTSLCNPLVLQAIVSMVGGRTPTLSWTLPRNINPSFAPTDLAGRILQVNPQAFGNGGNFTFTLLATNYLGVSSVLQSLTVLATNMPVPLIFPIGVTQITSTAAKAVRIYNSVTVNPCYASALAPMAFTWTVTPALDLSSVSLNTPNLVVAPNVFIPGTAYNATLRVALKSNPTALYTEITYAINVVSSPLEAYIAGGEWRKVRADAASWTVDGSRSSDPDAVSVGQLTLSRASAGVSTSLAAATEYTNDQYTYSWTCTTATGDKCFDSTTGSTLNLASAATLTLTKGQLSVGVYTFVLTYTHTATKRTATATTLINVRPGSNPSAYGASGTVDVLLDVFEVVISPQQKLHLVSTLPTYYTDSTSDLVYIWEVLGGGAGGITTSTLVNNPNVQGVNSSTLVLNAQELENFFVPGTDYHFKVTVYHNGDVDSAADAGQALVYVRVNALPTCDSFTATPDTSTATATTGVSFNSTFSVTASNCYDADSSALLYYTFFRLDEQGNRFNLLPVSQSPLGRVPLLPSGSASNKNLITLGVVITDDQGGFVEYTSDITVTPNQLVRGDNIDSVSALQTLYTNGWKANAALTLDTESLLVTQAAILTELNEVAALHATGTSSPFTATQSSSLLSFKKSLLTDLGVDAANLPSIQILQALVELVEDQANTDKALLASTIDFTAARAPQEGGAGRDTELLDTYVRVIKQALDYVVAKSGAVTGSASRRLFSVHESMELGVAENTPTTADDSSIVSSGLATLNLLTRDISSYSLMTAQETYVVTLDNAQGLSGAVGRAAVGQSNNVSTLDGFGVLTSATGFSGLTKGSFIDFGVWGLTPVPFVGLISAADAATIVSGGASVAAYVPSTGAATGASTKKTDFASGDVEVVVPLNVALSTCVSGDYTQTTSDGAASGNVYGNMCKIGCKVWDGSSLSDTGATMVALHPLSKRVVCGITAPGVVVAYSTRLSAPYVIPADTSSSTNGSVSTTQANGLPLGVVRASLLLQPAPVVTDLAGFESQIVTDLATIVGVPSNRAVVRAVSTNGDASTIIWDFLPQGSSDATVLAAVSTTTSQQYYDSLIAQPQSAFDPQPVLKYTQLSTISQMCDDGVYRHQCSSSSSSRASWELPVIIAACVLVFLCIVACCVYACIRLRRSRAAGGDSLKMAPPMMGTDLVPAKKFVYTAPNSESGNANEDKPSEITVMAKGLEFEPSNIGSGNGATDAEASKNRLAAKFPQKAAAAGAAAGVAGEEAKEESQKSSHHFYYVDESVKAAPTPSGASRRESGVAFSLNQGGRNELSGSGNSRSGNSQQQMPATPASQRQQRRPSTEDAAVDKAALPVVRPGGK